MREVPELLVQKCRELGDEGREWLVGLDNLIEELQRDWQITVGSSLVGGSEGYVAEAETKDGSEAVLKIVMPEMAGNASFINEVSVLRAADGSGYAQLLADDIERRAMLMERLGGSLRDMGMKPMEQMGIICSTLKQAWLHLPPESLVRSGAGVADSYAEFITTLWEELNGPCSRSALDLALDFARSRKVAFDPKIAVLAHGDAHSGNTLLDRRASSETELKFKFVDPDGLAAEPAYDLGVLMREWIEEIVEEPIPGGLERRTRLARLTGVDGQAIWEWGFIQCMSTGLFLVQLGQKQLGAQMLSVADAWSKVR